MKDQLNTTITTAKEAARSHSRSRTDAESRAAEARRQLAALEQQIADDERAAAEAAAAEEQSRRQAADAERMRPPAPVSLKVARAQAAKLLEALSPARDTDAEVPDPAGQWVAIDDVRARLLTSEVADDARSVIIAVEAIVQAADDWELARSKGASIVGSRPSTSAGIKTLIDELQSILAGEAPRNKVPEGIGTLIGQDVPPSQIALMIGCRRPDNSADVPLLGVLIDRGLKAAGFDEVASLTHTRHLGAINSDDAWTSRQATVEERRRAIPRSSDHRPGRDPDRNGCDTETTTGDPWQLSPVEVEIHRAARFGEFLAQQSNRG